MADKYLIPDTGTDTWNTSTSLYLALPERYVYRQTRRHGKQHPTRCGKPDTKNPPKQGRYALSILAFDSIPLTPHITIAAANSSVRVS